MSEHRPLTIAHRAGNDLARLRAAIAADVDYTEADVWLAGDELAVQHDRPAALAWWGPFWPLRRAPLPLTEVLAGARGTTLLIDISGRDPDTAQAVAGAVDQAGAEDRVAGCGDWNHLDRLGELLPRVPRFYTIGKVRDLESLRPRLARREVRAVSIYRGAVTPAIVRELKNAGVETTIAWTVNDPAEARRLLSWGIDGITSDSLELLAALRS